MLNRKLDDAPYAVRNALATGYLNVSNTSDHSLINEHLTMRGDLESDADILVKGKIYGNIRCKLLIVDSSARIEGTIDADEVVVRGSTKGKILAERVRLEKSADVESDIEHVSFAAEEGARIRGALKYTEKKSSSVPAAGE